MQLPDTTAGPGDQLTSSPWAATEARRGWLKRLGAVLGAGLLARPAQARAASPTQVQGANAYVGEIILLANNFAPRGYALCQGQTMSIAQNTALFSLLGITYGGDGRTTFNLPNLQGATPIGQGQAPGLSPYDLGQVIANQTQTLATNQLPAHTHLVPASASAATSSTPVGFVPAVASGTNVNGEAVAVVEYAPTPDVLQAAGAVGSAGSSAAVGIQSPYLVLNYCIALQGYYPQRP